MILPERFYSTDAARAGAGCHAIDLTKTPDRSRTASASGRVNRSYNEVAAEVDVNQSVATASRAARPESTHSFKLWENDEFSFGDLVDVINPLQHIPIIATIYRNWTHDKIGFAPRVIGGAIWGRIGGLVTGLINSAVEWFTGKDIGDHIYSALFNNSNDTGIATVVAAKDRSPANSNPNSARAGEKLSRTIENRSSAPRDSADQQNHDISTPLSKLEPLSSNAFAIPPARLLNPHVVHLYASSAVRDEPREKFSKVYISV